MPVCRDCGGTGQREVKREITTRCPDCDGTKLLPDGSACKRCNKWGEVGTGEFEVEKKLCRTCLGTGRISEGSLTVWFLLRAVPATLLVLGGGGATAWTVWTFLQDVLITAILTILVFSAWGGLMYFFISQMPKLGEISALNWFLIRAVPTTLVALGTGGAAVWAVWSLLANTPIISVIILAAFAVWGALMYYFISHLPE
jgi:hypothetical protein